MSNLSPNQTDILVHQYGQTFTWCIMLNITIILASRRHFPFAQLLHRVLGGLILLSTYFFILWFLVPYGFIQSQKQFILYYLHAIIGCAMLAFIFIQVASGIAIILFKNQKTLKIFKIIRYFHIIFACFLAILFKINILWNWYGVDKVFYFLITWQSITLIFYITIKVIQKNITLFGHNLSFLNKWEKNTNNSLKNEQLNQNHILFGNYVFLIKQIIQNHPGGRIVIQEIRGREIDRFIYGMYSTQTNSQIEPFSHPVSALKLLKNPIFKLSRPSLYQGLTQFGVKVKIHNRQELSQKTKINIIRLASVQNEIEFKGYTNLKQLGQFHSLTIPKYLTRLYTCVNFLRSQNYELMKKIIKIDEIQSKRIYYPFQQKQLQLSSINQKKKILIDKNVQQYIPLMIKIYSQGKFTQKLQLNNYKFDHLTLSCPKGKGLEISQTTKGRIIILAGGTGLFPFSDFIDLYFKYIFLQKNPSYNQIIIQLNPLANNKVFQNIQVLFLLAINQPQDIHPITIAQLTYISNYSNRFKVVMRISKNGENLKLNSKNIQFTREYFTKRIQKEIKNDFTKIWLCGPPKMMKQTAQILNTNGVQKNKILFV